MSFWLNFITEGFLTQWILGTGFSGIFVSGTVILDSSRKRDYGFLELYSEFQISRGKISRIPESGFRYLGRPFSCLLE